ncbi:hypothetical protein [Jannaschia sp. CCS1]|uniref:hypothetical protein n=1 Tax=Jannaschia sp. (strain CCS1) TaxID=290400 RepID=UPI000053C809|nr:hypothetical protein [Jannaschia sp. CCS1]ABD53151.1 hypothetical protein Jann_0234 [Jannaschia sp. CCS1]
MTELTTTPGIKSPETTNGIAAQLGIGFEASDDGEINVKLSEPDAIPKVFGTENKLYADTLLLHALTMLSVDEAKDAAVAGGNCSFMVGAIADMAPQDGFERLLITQMAATHMAVVRAGRRMANAQQVKQFEAYSNNFNKLTRTYAAQMEALRKHRNGGKQIVQVQHVNVEDGGQAIVGTVQTGAGVQS